MVFSIKDVAVVGGLGILAFIILTSGRELAAALGNIKLPSIGDITLPSFEFPNIFGDSQQQVTMAQPSPVTGQLLMPQLGDVPLTAAEVSSVIPQPDFFQSISDFFTGRDSTDIQEIAPSPPISETIIGGGQQFSSVAELLEAQRLRNEMRQQEQQQQQIMQQQENLIVQSQIPGQQFMGGGPSFQGGTIFSTPIEFLSLSQIIEMGLAESASGAANLRAIAQGFTEEEQQFLNQQPLMDIQPQIFGNAPRQFQGLTPEEIALQLTGGVISNF